MLYYTILYCTVLYYTSHHFVRLVNHLLLRKWKTCALYIRISKIVEKLGLTSQQVDPDIIKQISILIPGAEICERRRRKQSRKERS